MKSKWLFPKPVALHYQQELLKMANRWAEKLGSILDSLMEKMSYKRDASTEDWLTRFYLEMDNALDGIPPYILQAIAQEGVNFTDDQWEKITTEAFGVPLMGARPELSGYVRSWVIENTQLIKKLEQDVLSEVQRRVRQGFSAGLSRKSIRDLILSDKKLEGLPYGSSVVRNVKSRAELIAIDQLSSLNGSMMRYDQTSIGVKGYIWETSKDIRVRGAKGGLYPYAEPSHADRQGEKFNWDKPPSDGHPGASIRCRCWARPDWESMDGTPIQTPKTPRGKA